MRVPRARAKGRSRCPDCVVPVKQGQWIFKDIQTGEWLHPKCWWTRIKVRQEGATPELVE